MIYADTLIQGANTRLRVECEEDHWWILWEPSNGKTSVVAVFKDEDHCRAYEHAMRKSFGLLNRELSGWPDEEGMIPSTRY